MTSVLSGQADIGFAGPEAAIYVYNEGKKIMEWYLPSLPKETVHFLWEEKQKILNGKILKAVF